MSDVAKLYPACRKQSTVFSLQSSVFFQLDNTKTMINTPEIKQFIKENSSLFWWIKEGEKENISQEFLVETILNYGDIKSVKKLFKLIGINKVAEIFYKQTVNNKQRTACPVKCNEGTIYTGKIEDRGQKTEIRLQPSVIGFPSSV